MDKYGEPFVSKWRYKIPCVNGLGLGLGLGLGFYVYDCLCNDRFRVNEEIDHLNDLVALLVVFGQSEEGEDPEEDDPQLQALRSELEEKATTAKKLVCIN